jgi:hypothetical protein
MMTPLVRELRRPLEPVSPDPFLRGLEDAGGPLLEDAAGPLGVGRGAPTRAGGAPRGNSWIREARGGGGDPLVA